MQRFIKKFLLILLMLVGASRVHAATLDVVVNNVAPDINQPVRVDIPLNTQGEDANAIQAQIMFPASQFILRSVDDGASPVSFWIEPPAEIASGIVSFSGIIPGGFEGSASSVVSLWLSPVASGTGVISLGDVELLRNDGQGTPMATATGTAAITVSGAAASSTSSTRPVSLVSPEPFTPIIAQDTNVFNGKYFLVFLTTDKGSGIAYYEVMEVPRAGSSGGASSSWNVATSPYLLQDQTLQSTIYVRAVDHTGHFVVVEVPPKNPVSAEPLFVAGHGKLEVLGALALIVLLLLCAVLCVIAWRRRRK